MRVASDSAESRNPCSLIRMANLYANICQVGQIDDTIEQMYCDMQTLIHETGGSIAGQGEVLARDGQAVERPGWLSPGKGGVRRSRAFDGGFRNQGDDGVDRRVHRLDAVEEPGHELFGAQLALDEPAHQVAGRGEDDLGVRGEVVAHGVQGLVWVVATRGVDGLCMTRGGTGEYRVPGYRRKGH